MIRVEMRTVSGMNAREHWRARHRRVQDERMMVKCALLGKPKPSIPCSVRLTRVAPSAGLDDDNLASALKPTRDQVAHWLGVDDRHSSQVRYVYAQQRGARGGWAVLIEFGEPVAGAQFELLSGLA